ncbi:MAG: hypothetical protein QME90_05830 [Thermodesulfobacteriota bacterium]|nr:hypothetical protein [Thermodesulfobacteriota bacterium]
MMVRPALKELIKRTENKPETTILLLQAVQDPENTLKTFYFTPSIEEYFENILEQVARGKGGGFWIQAEYGAGKTHFLAALGCLLMADSENPWNSVRSATIQPYARRLKGKTLFPIIINLKGEADFHGKDNLLRVIERHIEEILDEKGLHEKVFVTTEDELIEWYEKNKLRAQIDAYIKSKSGKSASDLGRQVLADLIRQYCDDEGTTPRLSASTKTRITYIYNQLLKQGFSGLLFIIDEYASWQDRHPVGTPEYAMDEEVLETLSWELPKGRDFEIYTIVASQKPAPAKLRGERFENFLLLGGKNEKDYDVIVSYRVRDLIQERLPEIEGYYEDYFKDFKFLKNTSKEYFLSTFPFQPRVFEVIRRITARELPTARLGISVVWDTLYDLVLSRNGLITVSDLMVSTDLYEALNNTLYKPSFDAYNDSINALSDFDFDEGQEELAKRIIKTLFLWHIAFLETPRPLSEIDLTEATLTVGDVVKGEDEVRLILNQLRELPQIEYTKEKGALFKTERAGRGPRAIFTEIKKKLNDPNQIQKYWEEALKISPLEAEGEKSLFSGFEFDAAKPLGVEFRKIEYPGEVVLSRDWRPEFGEKIKDHSHFRIVFLTKPTKIDPSEVEDLRIAISVPSEMSGAAKDEARNLWTVYEIQDQYKEKSGIEAEEIKDWLPGKKREGIRNLFAKQSSFYRDGEIVTSRGIGIDSKKAFSAGNIERAIEEIAVKVLANAYSEPLVDSMAFKTRFKSSYAKNVFDGLLKGASGASASACENFAPALGLSQPDSPTKYRPQESKVFSMIETLFSESGQELPLWKLYDKLETKHGLTKEFVTLYLLCFIARGRPPVEIALKPGSRLGLKGNKISASNIKEVEWKARFDDDFETLILAEPGEIWNNIIEFGRIVNPILKSASAPDDIREQEDVLLQTLKRMGEEAKKVKETLGVISTAFGEDMSEADAESINFLSSVSKSTTYTEFYRSIKDKDIGLDEFKNAVAKYSNLKAVSDQGTDLLRIKTYLDEVVIPEDNSLSLNKLSLVGQIQVKSFIENPSHFKAVKETFEKFQESYQRQYQIHHREYYKLLKGLREKLEDAESKVEAISRLSKLPEVGITDVEIIPSEYQNLLKRVTHCPASDPVQVHSNPFCKDCPSRVSLDAEAPLEQINDFIRGLEKNLSSAKKRLSQLITRQIIAEDKGNKLDKLIKAIQATKLDSFVTSLTDELLDILRRCIEKANIVTEVVPVLSRAIDQFSVVDEENLDDFLRAIRAELEKAIKEAKRKNPGKKVRISLK